MPNPFFEPVIGGGFDQVAGQRAGWAQFNRGVESENLARAAAAEQSQNSWLARVQQINQAAADAQDRSQSEAERLAEQSRQFDVSAGLSGDLNRTRYAAEADRTAAINNQTAANRLQADRFDASVDSAAQTLAPRIHEFGTAAEAAQTDKDRAYAALRAKTQDLQTSVPDGVMFKGKGFVPVNSADAKAAKAASQANLSLASAQADYSDATQKFNLHQKQFQDLTTHATKQYGLEIFRDGDNWVVKNPANNRIYRPDGKTKPGPKPLAPDVSQPQFSGFMQPAPTAPSMTWPGFSAQIGAQPEQPRFSTEMAPTAPQTGALFNPPNLREGIPAQQNSSPFTEGQVIRNKRDGQLYRVTNGVPVLVQ